MVLVLAYQTVPAIVRPSNLHTCRSRYSSSDYESLDEEADKLLEELAACRDIGESDDEHEDNDGSDDHELGESEVDSDK